MCGESHSDSGYFFACVRTAWGINIASYWRWAGNLQRCWKDLQTLVLCILLARWGWRWRGIRARVVFSTWSYRALHRELTQISLFQKFWGLRSSLLSLCSQSNISFLTLIFCSKGAKTNICLSFGTRGTGVGCCWGKLGLSLSGICLLCKQASAAEELSVWVPLLSHFIFP